MGAQPEQGMVQRAGEGNEARPQCRLAAGNQSLAVLHGVPGWLCPGNGSAPGVLPRLQKIPIHCCKALLRANA